MQELVLLGHASDAAAEGMQQGLPSPNLLDHLLFPFGLLFCLFSFCHILGSNQGQTSPHAVLYPASSHPVGFKPSRE